MSKEKIKSWTVDIFINVESEPLWKVMVAKLIHHFWKGFKGA